jgi:nucleoside-diphosphate-sugar epimerase
MHPLECLQRKILHRNTREPALHCIIGEVGRFPQRSRKTFFQSFHAPQNLVSQSRTSAKKSIMSIPGKNVFLIGPGYIGLEIIDRLLGNGYNVTAMTRREDAAKALKQSGVTPVMGSLEDTATITSNAAANDIVIHSATADDLPSVEAVIAGIDQRADEGEQTIYIHTSGCSFLSDDSNGEYKTDMIYSDKHPEDMDARPDSASHRGIDLAIIAARRRLGTKAKIFIMLPPLIYGATKHNRLSIQMITMARFAMKHKYAGYAGKGKSVWRPIHVADLSRGYLTMLQWLERSPEDVALEHPYFFCENGTEISWSEAAGIIGDELKAAGILSDAAPRQIPESDYDDLFGMYTNVVIAQNSRNKADRLRELGWQPEHLSVREAFKLEEMPILLSDSSEFKGYAKPAASGSG